ncbi:MAG: hypothetical protein RID25_00630, partial [Cyclobacteriaceae bacterium]
MTTAGALVDINAGTIEADVTGGISLDAGGASNFNTSGTNTLTLGTIGDAQTIISSAGTTASALDLNATAGGVDIDGGTTVAIDGATGLSLGTAANDIDINAAGELDLDGGTTVAIDGATGVTINSTANDVDITGAANTNIGATTGDIDLTAAGEVTLNGTNTQVETGSFELNSGTTVTNIQASIGGGGAGVRADGVADDNTLVTESA